MLRSLLYFFSWQSFRPLRRILLWVPFYFLAVFVAKGNDFVPSALTSGMKSVVNLHGDWKTAEGLNKTVPFVEADLSQLEISCQFDISLSEYQTDACYLYFEALAWSAEIYLNGRLLKVTEDPFAEQLLPLNKKWLKATGNEVRVVLDRSGSTRPLYPEPFIGIHRQAHVLVTDVGAEIVSPPQYLLFASKAILLAPWSEITGFGNDLAVVKQYTSGIFAMPSDLPIVLAFRPSNAAMQWLSGQGRQLVYIPETVDSIGFYNAYPIGGGGRVLHPDFWRDTQLKPMKGYGSFQQWEALKAPRVEGGNRVALLSLMLIPILGLLVIRLGLPRVYETLPEYLSKTKIYLELIGNNKFLKSGQKLLMGLIRILITTTTLTLYIYYLSESGSLDRLNLLSEKSIPYQFFRTGNASAPAIFGVVFLIILLSNGLKYAFLNLAGGIYRVGGLASSVQALDVFASFPLNLLSLLPLTFMFFTEPEIGTVLLYVWYGLFLVYMARRVVLIYAGISRLYSFSASLKFLYICILEILPWFLLL